MFPFNFDDNETSEDYFSYPKDYAGDTNGINEYNVSSSEKTVPNNISFDYERDRRNDYSQDRRDGGSDRRIGERDRRDGNKRDRRGRRDYEHDDRHGREDTPKSAPPKVIPPRDKGFDVRAIDPIALRGCLYKYIYVWLVNRQQFWMYPTCVGRDSISGYRWNGYKWIYAEFDLKLMESFSCFG